MGDVDGQLRRRAGRHRLGRQRIAVAGDRDTRRRRRRRPTPSSRTRNLIVWLLVDDAEARRRVDDDAPVALVVVAGEQHVQRRARGRRGAVRGDVVDLAVGQHDDGADPLRRHVGERCRQRARTARCRRPATPPWLAPASTVRTSMPLKSPRRSFSAAAASAVVLSRPSRDLAGALVDDQRDDGRQRLAVLAEEHRVERAPGPAPARRRRGARRRACAAQRPGTTSSAASDARSR